ncbi:cyclic dehypoxanthinyl futalosine synthase [Sporomusa termitida]|uniref:Cyclic dehypoxanthine futalosine synthase n=1 Tax=Sporomusa termitida TaxID=2377 RepID=A0A517DYN9_9FIRM|nr:cyclic dehypoxanthinyl futalosine synthase [Sporomusa termitida]QDR82469.1 Cyclic dehypoxanthine futalosine synthase [Sporomusa termitida]
MGTDWRQILNREWQKSPLTDEEALLLLQAADIWELGQAADLMRQHHHPDSPVTFIIDRNINYTNVCTNQCKFCAFYRQADAQDAYLLDDQSIYQKIGETIAAGGTQIMLQGGLHPGLGLAYFEKLLRGIKERFAITIHSLSPTEIVDLAAKERLTVQETLSRLKKAGLDSLPGGGAEILDDAVRLRVSPDKISVQQWLDTMATAHRLGMATTATMVIGLGETYQQRINHLRVVRELQALTGGFRAFIMWTFQPGNTQLGGGKASSWEYLRTLAVARLYLHNIKHLQGSWVTQGQSIGQLTLAFGANDLGSIMLEENVVRAAGTANHMSTEYMVDIIRGAGKKAAQRDTAYNIIKMY